ncbi:Argonaute siRNA chaperone complex subunit Arb1-domain-containing protein [Jimgerdemannia flammicorona]|uniref:Argonaute siRNA chaperone complex subunit Arb1-domain-containing protein n=1 Tax=Jimgerdemannia flammicorona TaxID=994334 RepID=A0A433D654_9FUNG|nr:Argonaute siRNA chaperone complex subunit Arb1-domain-containing protein [Jimgerdemannia flammicorona]
MEYWPEVTLLTFHLNHSQELFRAVLLRPVEDDGNDPLPDQPDGTDHAQSASSSPSNAIYDSPPSALVSSHVNPTAGGDAGDQHHDEQRANEQPIDDEGMDSLVQLMRGKLEQQLEIDEVEDGERENDFDPLSLLPLKISNPFFSIPITQLAHCHIQSQLPISLINKVGHPTRVLLSRPSASGRDSESEPRSKPEPEPEPEPEPKPRPEARPEARPESEQRPEPRPEPRPHSGRDASRDRGARFPVFALHFVCPNSVDKCHIRPTRLKQPFVSFPSTPSIRPLIHRVRSALRKYRQHDPRLTTDVKRRAMLNDYLRFGGVITSVPRRLRDRRRRGGRGGPNENGSSDEEFESAAAANRDPTLLDDLLTRGELRVGFANVAELWLGARFVRCNRFPEPECFRDAAEVVKDFLEFLVERKVCPEHLVDIEDAMRVAERAGWELPKCKALMTGFPGKFNRACAIEFGGDMYDIFSGFEEEDEREIADMVGVSRREVEELVAVFKQEEGGKKGNNKEERSTAGWTANVKDGSKRLISVHMRIIGVDGLNKGEDAMNGSDDKGANESKDGTANGIKDNDTSLTSNKNTTAHGNEDHDAGTNKDTTLHCSKDADASSHSSLPTVAITSPIDNIPTPIPTLFPNLCTVHLRDFRHRRARPIAMLLERDLAQHFLVGMSMTGDFHRLHRAGPAETDKELWYLAQAGPVMPTFHRAEEWEVENEEEEEDDVWA